MRSTKSRPPEESDSSQTTKEAIPYFRGFFFCVNSNLRKCKQCISQIRNGKFDTYFSSISAMNIFNTREIEKRSSVTKIGRMKIENYIVHVGRDG